MNLNQRPFDGDADTLFENRYRIECTRVNRFMIWLMFAQWIVGIGFAVFYSPLTWIGQNYEIHVHIWAAVLLGGSISGFAILWARLYPDTSHTRHVIAATQMLWSALLIHLSGGRIETHFHVFASLAILSIYRDWKILITATVVVAVDHFVRGVFYPLSAFGTVVESPFRWMEHAAWVIFEVSFLVPGCMRLRKEIHELCQQQTELEHAKQSVDIKVAERTHELTLAIQRLAKKTEEAEKLALVAQYTDNAVVITDGESRIEWVNEGFTRVSGYQLDEVIGKRPSDFLHGPLTNYKTVERMHRAFRNKTAFDTEIINYRKNGDPFWLAIELRPIRCENGEVSRFIAIESDVSQRKSMEVSLASARQRLQSLVDNVPGAFYRCRADEKCSTLFMSKSIESISGYLPSDFTENGPLEKTDLVCHEDRVLVRECLRQAIADEGDYEIEYRIQDKSGNTKWVWEQGQCLRDDDGLLVFDGVIFDITDRKVAEAELASKGKIIEDALNEIYIFDAVSLKFCYANRGGRTNIGYTLEELRQLTPVDIKPEYTIDSFKAIIESLETGVDQQIVFQTPYLRKNGTRYIAEVRLQKSRFQDRDVYLAMILDITERIASEKKNNQLQSELVLASRKAGMAEVATGVLHNVGNILNSVNVSASMIRKKFENSAIANLSRASDLILEHQDEFADFVLNDNRGRKLPNYILQVSHALSDERTLVCEEFDDLLKNVEHIKEIVSVQQSMAKSSGVNQKLCPQQIINDVLTATRGSIANHNIRLVQKADDDIPELVSDKHKILQILINLVGNAKDALMENKSPDPTIQIGVKRDGDQVVFQVIDNGIGIPNGKLSKVFQYGFTTKSSGHGFGLHCSANAAAELGGSLTASSEGLGRGACFRLAIPFNHSCKSSDESAVRDNDHVLQAR